MSDVIDTEALANALGLKHDAGGGYNERSLSGLHAELRLATNLVWERMMAKAFERMDEKDAAKARLKELEEIAERMKEIGGPNESGT